MNHSNFNLTRRLTISALSMALYLVVLYFTQSFSFGATQIRIATSLYSLGYFFPFLVVPLGVANLLSNLLFGGLGPLDMIGGCLVGMATTGCMVLIRRFSLSPWFAILPITFIPGLGVATWLSYLLGIPYPAMAFSLCVGQFVCGICGALLIRLLNRYRAKGAFQL